jgi:hypothetical protein
MRSEVATTEMSPLQLATLCHTARLCNGAPRRTPKRTVRMRVHDFKPLSLARPQPARRGLSLHAFLVLWLGLGLLLGHLAMG